MSDLDTSSYWRKRLELDAPLPPDVLKEHHYPHARLRPLFYLFWNLVFKYWNKQKNYYLERLPEKPPYILAPNHGSTMDFPAVALSMGKRREELYPVTTFLHFDNFFAGFWVKVGANAVRIDPLADYFTAMRAAARVLRAGKAVYIHPEGMRTMDGTILPFRVGVGVLAVETGVPLVPVYIHNTWKALPTGKLFIRPSPISVSFGEPMDMGPYIEKKKTMQAYDVYKEVTDDLQKRVAELQKELPAR